VPHGRGLRRPLAIAQQLVGVAHRSSPLHLSPLDPLAGVGEDARRVGRKSLAGGDRRSPRFSFRTTPELYEQAALRAQRESKSLSELAREALEQYLGTP
jgi:hypothetical protein